MPILSAFFRNISVMAEINIRDNGPILVRGEMTITDAGGKAYDLEGKEAVALCRCGKSQNSPFCDGAHKDGFACAPRAP